MRAAIIGFGAMGRRHALAASRVQGLEVAGICDIRVAALEAPEAPAEALRSTDLSGLLRQVGPELVVVSTTAPTHKPVVKAAVDAGARAILCEKPIACSLSDARWMIDACSSAGVRLAVNHCRRHVPAYGWLARCVQTGEWGRLRAIRISCPGIGLACLGTHFLDLMRYVSREDFTSVTGWVDAGVGPNPRGAQFHDPGGLIVAETASGGRFVHQQIEDGAGPASIVLDLTQARIVVEEMDGRVELIRRHPDDKPGPGRPPRLERVQPPPEAVLKLDVVEMTAAVLREFVAGSSLTCDAEHGYRSLEAVVAAHLSSGAGHCPQRLPLTNPDHLLIELPIT